MAQDGWEQTIDNGFREVTAVVWDPVVVAVVADYNARLKSTPGYVPVDYKLILSMIWVESGGPLRAAWMGRVMQIGNSGDPGLAALKKREGAAKQIVRGDTLAVADRSESKDINTPATNIQLGIAYLFVRMAQTEVATLYDAGDTSLHEYKVQPGDNAAKIADREGTTIDEIRTSSTGIKDIAKLHAGDVVHFRKATIGIQITGWLTFDEDTIASRYNGGGDSRYAEKLRYVRAKLNR